MATKHKRIFAALKHDVDAVVLVNGVEPNLDMSFFYATGIKTGLFESCLAIVKPTGVEVLSSELEELSARSAGARTTVFRSRRERIDIVKKRLRGMKRLGVNSEEMTHANFQFLKKYAHRVTYGTDMPYTQRMFSTTFRIMESLDEHFYEQDLYFNFNYHWPMHGFGLPDDVLRNVYRETALNAFKQARSSARS